MPEKPDPFQELMHMLAMVRNARYPAWSRRSEDEREYFVGVWTAEGIDRRKAIKVVQDPFTINLILISKPFGLEAILLDTYAIEGLRKCLVGGKRLVWDALGQYVGLWKPDLKPGPKPKGGKYQEEIASEWRAKGLTNGQISLKMFGTAAKRNVVSAMVSQRKKKLAARRSTQ
jgi:hypothetical protein